MTTTTAMPRGELAPRRPLRSRFSTGHVLMLVAGSLAALLNLSVLRAGDHSVPVAIAARDLPAGETIEPSALTLTELDAGADVIASLLGPDQLDGVVGYVTTRAITVGELVSVGDLRAPGAPGQLRAMSIPIEPAHAVGGALRPGDRVDIIEVADSGPRFVAADVEVLDVADRSGGALGGLAPYSVTVAVDADAALRVAAAIRADALELVRSTGATELEEPTG